MSNAPRASGIAKDWGSDDSASPILHVDMDSFFASVEVALDPRLRGVPLIVGGLGNRGVVTSCTYDVRALGVRAGMPMSRARALAPNATVLPGRRQDYATYSHRVMELLGRYTPRMEAASIDEAYLDVSGAKRQFGSPMQIAVDLREKIRTQLGLPASVGIAANKTVAKIASAHAKPNGVLLIPADATGRFLAGLPIGALPGIGRKSGEALTARGIDTLGDLAQWDFKDLERIVGPTSAYSLQRRARGEDTSRVGQRESEKSISTEETFSHNLMSRAQVSAYLNQAAYQCARRLRSSQLRAWTVHLKLRDASFRTVTRSLTLFAPTDVGREIADAVLQLFDREALPAGGVRLAGVGVSGLVSLASGVPVPLEVDPRPREVEAVMDRVQEKFGISAAQPASSLGKPWESSAR